jgi:histidine ammonia-lyase
MTFTLSSRFDLTMDAYERVAWRGEPVRIAPEAVERADAARDAFLRLVDDPRATVYGVTSGYGDRAGTRLEAEERRTHAASAGLRAASFGPSLPQRVIRGIVLARLANLVDGYAATSGALVEAVAGMLDGGPLPDVPSRGNGGSGEILALAHLFGPLMGSFDPGPKEGLALINGSPCAAALVADAALQARRRLDAAYVAFALSVEAFGAPLDAFDAALDDLWSDPLESRALARLRGLLWADHAGRRPHQGPVAYRILPRVLGQLERAVDAAAATATVSLRSVTDNPVYIPPTADHPNGRVLSTGGYHNAAGPAALHQLAVSWADLCQMAERHVERLVFGAVPSPPVADGSELLRLLMMTAVGYAEDARVAAQPVVLPRGGPGQNDVTSTAFMAWSREQAAAAAATASLAVLAAAAGHVASARDAPLGPSLREFHGDVIRRFPPMDAPRAFGTDLDALAEWFGAQVIPPVADRPTRDPERPRG